MFKFALNDIMFPSILAGLDRKSKNRGRRNVPTSKKPEYLRETSPDILEECFEDLQDHIKTRLDIDSSLSLLKSLGSSVSLCQCLDFYTTCRNALFVLQIICKYTMSTRRNIKIAVVRIAQFIHG